MQKTKSEFYTEAIDWIKTTKDIIILAHQIEVSIRDGNIQPQNIVKTVRIGPENNDHLAEIDWTKYQYSLKKNFANILKINTVSYQIIVLKESYAALLINNNLAFATKTNNPDLWAAQEILRHIRNALGHMRSDACGAFAQATWDFTNNGKVESPGKLEIASIKVILDTTDLQHKVFNWNQMGGIKNFFKVLDYLIKDLSDKISEKL